MFTVAYRIIHHGEDEVIGESGFFRIASGEAAYGEWWSEELWHIMPTVWLGSWFENVLDACLALQKHDFVAIWDAETIGTWLEWKQVGERVEMNVTQAPGWKNDRITYEPIPAGYRRQYPTGAFCTYDQLKAEVIAKARQYLADIRALNPQLFQPQAPSEQTQPFVETMHRIQGKIQLLIQEERP